MIPEIETAQISVITISDHKISFFSDMSLGHKISYGWIFALMAASYNKIKTNNPQRVDKFSDFMDAFAFFQLMMLL